jgi:LemA protein
MMVIVVLAIVVLAVLFAIGVYNGLVGLRVRADNAWSDIDVQLKRRHELIPNLVETVRGYAGHERETLEAVVDARNRAAVAATPADRAQAEGALTQALRQVFALAEAYPQLRAAENFAQLQAQLAQIEDAIQNARRYYNAVVRDLNTQVVQFPSNLIANAFGIGSRPYFELDDAAERQAPKVSFSSRP